MGEINKPTKRTFWKITSADGTTVIHEGFTEIGQVTTTGQPILNHAAFWGLAWITGYKQERKKL